MAIENVWIIDGHSGICIYDWCDKSKIKTIDEQLVSGLLLAFRNFSSEAGLVDISAIEGIDRKLAYQSDDRFIVASICHQKDYEPLINRTLMGILEDFRKKYKDIIESDSADVSPYRTFDEDLIDTLEDTAASRSVVTTLVGAIASTFIIGAVFVAYFFINLNGIFASIPNDAGNLVGLIILLVGFIIAGFFGGLVAGERRFGMIASFISVVPVITLFIIFFQSDWIWPTEWIFNALLYFLLFSIMSLVGGILGGYIKERRLFYPINADIEVEEDEFEK